jgi:hypothetical protein
MIVWRLTAQVKLGHTQELVAISKSIKSTLPNPDAMRIYVTHPVSSPSHNVVTDIEFESLTALEQWLGEWFAKPENAEVMKEMNALQEPGGGSTIWNLQE